MSSHRLRSSRWLKHSPVLLVKGSSWVRDRAFFQDVSSNVGVAAGPSRILNTAPAAHYIG